MICRMNSSVFVQDFRHASIGQWVSLWGIPMGRVLLSAQQRQSQPRRSAKAAAAVMKTFNTKNSTITQLARVPRRR
jgi:hypothetical protein